MPINNGRYSAVVVCTHESTTFFAFYAIFYWNHQPPLSNETSRQSTHLITMHLPIASAMLLGSMLALMTDTGAAADVEHSRPPMNVFDIGGTSVGRDCPKDLAAALRAGIPAQLIFQDRQQRGDYDGHVGIPMKVIPSEWKPLFQDPPSATTEVKIAPGRSFFMGAQLTLTCFCGATRQEAVNRVYKSERYFYEGTIIKGKIQKYDFYCTLPVPNKNAVESMGLDRP
ncbi:hypothetical protein SYNPS1DRAFT_31617 [Syncephalis pseudoplumigaleata]|uniref:Uncharacterized protein n=1 Tax=Syncephalis pseudoplumigaleata TaxID=1712513 RepID=A0A4P9YSA5_9FUNG|nr:hypothetical protein SYNPS1DRAFT_31617 [Syncephalis pseudoplumigaleata]|eukprot:RKP22747.1 hypothetical protein SYNPS1DRAFT_31617 [Syncephalis pseudoplumigaleata]